MRTCLAQHRDAYRTDARLSADLPVALLFFNVGIEVDQLIFIAAARAVPALACDNGR